MKILIFTEGTILMHKNGSGLPRKEIVKQVEERESSVSDYASYVSIGNAPEKIKKWISGGAVVVYITSRKKSEEIEMIRSVLKKYDFPDGNLVYRQDDETYADVAEKIMPDILVEDDCESIGGEVEMIYSHIRADLREKIKSVIIKEFAGIDILPDKF